MMHIQKITQDEKLARLRLIRSENVGPVTYQHLLHRYGNAQKALAALPELAKNGGRKKPLRAYPKAAAIREWDQLDQLGGEFLFTHTRSYPDLLSHTEGHPPVLACLGNVHLTKSRSLGIVGGRNATLNGQKLAHRFAEVMGEAGFTIASGLARGIDTAAHQGSLSTGTIAVLAGGIDIVYPKENQKLYDQIAETGCILSEMPMGAKPQARHFPKRNRIVTGLSEGVLVIEAALKSGSLISARLANEQGREVFAVPGSPLEPRTRGCNELIRQGATLTETPDDILNQLQFAQKTLREPKSTSQFELPLLQVRDDDLNYWRKKLMTALGPDPIGINDLIREMEAPIPEILCLLIELELAEKVTRHAGHRVSARQDTLHF